MDTLLINGIDYPIDLLTAGISSSHNKRGGINSFSILANEELTDWTVIVNQQELVGRYSTQASALGALVGCFIHAGATQDGLAAAITEQVANGRSQIGRDQRVVPGSTTPALWAADTEAVIAGGTAESTAKPIARWGNEMYQTTPSNSMEVFVVADHIEGIDYVAFTANNGTELQVSTPETLSFTDAFGETETIVAYKATIDLRSVSLSDKVEVRARVRPTFGTERILQGELSGSDLIISGDNPARRQGQFGSFVARFEEKVVNHSSGDIMTLINGTTLTSTEQLVIQLGSGLAQWGDIGATANMISLNGAYRPIIVRGVDSDYSSIITNSDTTDMTNGRTKDLSLRFEDLEFRSARLDLATNSNLSTANYISFFRCNMNQQWDNIIPLDNYTYTDPNGDTQFLGGGELTLPGNGELCLARVRDDSGNFYTGTPVVPYSVSGASYGYYLMECIGDFQCNAATALVRNYIHRDGIEDSTNNDCFLNLKVRGGGRGNYKNFKLINETLIWDNSTTSFPDNTTILVDLDAGPDGLDTDGGVPSTIPVRDRWRCYKNNSGAAMTFDPTSSASVELWTDTSPHVDASQPSELKNGSGDYVAIDNSLFYGLDVDASCSIQPRISRNANWETNSMWKNWNIDPAYDTSGVTTGSTVGGIVHYSNGAEFASQLLSYVYQHKDHWIVDNVVYDFGTRDTSETSGSLLFNYNDSGNRGWGNVPPTKTFDSCIRDATWKNSAFKLIQIDATDWALNTDTVLGPDLSDFKAYVADGTVVNTNDPAGRSTLAGNSWTIDVKTLTNSTMAVSTVPSSAVFGDWLNAANRSIQWSTIASGTGSFVNQVPVTGLNKIELFDNDGLTKRGMQLTFDAEADKDAFIAQTGTLTLAVTVTEAGHANVGTTYTYSWDFPDTSYDWAATQSMLKWQWRTAGTSGEDVPADGSDDLYGDNPTYLVSFA